MSKNTRKQNFDICQNKIEFKPILLLPSKRLLMKKLMQRWQVEKPHQVLIIFFVFSITGSTSVFVGRPFLKFLGVTLENFNAFIYYPLFIVFSFMFYQLFLVAYGWLFGQFDFFWKMEKKMLKRLGMKI